MLAWEDLWKVPKIFKSQIYGSAGKVLAGGRTDNIELMPEFSDGNLPVCWHTSHWSLYEELLHSFGAKMVLDLHARTKCSAWRPWHAARHTLAWSGQRRIWLSLRSASQCASGTRCWILSPRFTRSACAEARLACRSYRCRRRGRPSFWLLLLLLLLLVWWSTLLWWWSSSSWGFPRRRCCALAKGAVVGQETGSGGSGDQEGPRQWQGKGQGRRREEDDEAQGGGEGKAAPCPAEKDARQQG